LLAVLSSGTKATAAGLREVDLFNTADLQAIERENAAQLMPRYKT
jgi:hypothetical protein